MRVSSARRTKDNLVPRVRSSRSVLPVRFSNSGRPCKKLISLVIRVLNVQRSDTDLSDKVL